MGRPENPEISIVVIGWRRAPDLRRCLAALAETVDRHAVEIIVTLNEPAPALLAELANKPDLLDECLVAESNRGYALANNAGAQAARGTYLVLLNDDSVPQSGWLEPLIERLSSDQSIGAVGPVFVAPSGILLEAGCWLSSDAVPTSIGPSQLPRSGPVAGPVPYVSASALAFRREQFLEFGGFDPGYFPAYFEDTDLAMKYLDRGLSTWVEPASRVEHSPNDRVHRRYASYLVSLNRHRFVERWGQVLATFPPLGDPSVWATQVKSAVAAVTALAASPRRTGPAVPDVEILSEAQLRDRELQISDDFIDFVSSLLDQFEERDAKFQVLVAERDQVISSVIPEFERWLEAANQKLESANEELEAYRSRRLVRLLNALRRAQTRGARSEKS